jgi:hypothetical protein
VIKPFRLSITLEPIMVPLRVPHPLARGLGAGEAAIRKPPEIVLGLAPAILSHIVVASSLSVSIFKVLFVPVLTVVVRSTSPNAA